MTTERHQQSPKDRRGISFVEILIAAFIVAASMVPVLSLYTHQVQEAAFDDYHRMARCRAHRVAQTLAARGYEELAGTGVAPYVPDGDAGTAAGTDAGTGGAATTPAPAPAPADLAPGALPLAIPLPPVEEELARLGGATAAEELRGFAKASRRFAQGAWLEEVDVAGLVRVVVVVTWRAPGEPPACPAHVYRCAALVGRRDLSLTIRPPAPAAAAEDLL